MYNMSLGIIDRAMDFQMTEHWCNAVKGSTPTAFPSAVFAHVNVLQFAQAQDIWFTPDYDADGVIVQNDRLEQFRLACLYDATTNMLDIGVNLDDTMDNTIKWLDMLTRHAGTGVESDLEWLVNGNAYSIVHRTYRP